MTRLGDSEPASIRPHTSDESTISLDRARSAKAPKEGTREARRQRTHAFLERRLREVEPPMVNHKDAAE